MAAPRNRKHLVVRTPPRIEEYSPHPRRVPLRPVPGPGDRRQHARVLTAALRNAERETIERRDELGITVRGAEPGLYVEFESPPGIDLKLESLENRRKGIELFAVRTIERSEEPSVQLAAVFVPDGKLSHFVQRLEQYANEQTRRGEPRHKDLVDRIAALRRATLRALWTDSAEVYPEGDETIWWEVWLRCAEGREFERLLDFAQQVGLVVGERRLGFEDRIVVLVRGTAAQLSASLDVLNDDAEVRRAKDGAAFFADLPVDQQVNWVDDLKARVDPPSTKAPAVCILDTGVTRAHPLLDDVIDPNDTAAVDPTWGAHDDGGGPLAMGDGTEMAGLAAYGDLVSALAGSSRITFRHRVESVKILPARTPGSRLGSARPSGLPVPSLRSSPKTGREVARPVCSTSRASRGLGSQIRTTIRSDLRFPARRRRRAPRLILASDLGKRFSVRESNAGMLAVAATRSSTESGRET
jgi:hypothetical protein